MDPNTEGDSDGKSKIRGALNPALLGFPHELGLESHGSKSIDFAGNVMVSFHQPDVADFGSAFDGFGSAFHLQVFDHNHIVSVLKRIAIGVLNHGGFFLVLVLDGTPTVGAFRTCEDQAVFISVDRLT